MANQTPITNDAMLLLIIGEDLKVIIDELAKWLLEELQKSIEGVVYGAGNPSVYQRQRYDGGLIGSFLKKDTNRVASLIESGIEQDPTNMNVDPENYIHGSLDWEMDDVRELLTDWIIGGDSGNRFGNGFWRAPRDFWTPIESMISDGRLDATFERLMTAHGIVFTRA